MPPSRAAANAKTAQRFQRKQSLSQAKSIGNKFTEKQSHFERRREEEQVRSVQQQKGTNFASTAEITSGDGLLSNKEAWRRQDHQLSSFHGGSTETPSPFELASRAKNKSNIAGEKKPFTTQSSATFGMSRAAAGPRPTGRAGEAMPLGTRSTRRVARFNLGGGGGGAEVGAATGELGGSAMGVRRAREAPAIASSTDGLDHILNDGGDGEPATKMTKEERFKQVVSSSRSHRAQLQKERAERDAETNELDKEINSLLHLLPKRNKEEEEREAFARSGTPAVRELLASYKQGHVAKRLTIRSSGEFSLTDLTATKDSVSGKERGTPLAAEASDLDERSKELLARIRKGAARSAEEEETERSVGAAAAAAAPLAGDSREDRDPRKAAKLRDETPTAYVEDDFDVMLNQMRMDTRRAHATDRLLDEEEEAELAAQQLMLEEDRRAVPSLGLAEKNQVQMSRGEWVRKGGDDAFQMDEEAAATAADGAYEDNVDLPSSYEGDSDTDGEARSVDSEDETAFDMNDDEFDDGRPVIGEDEEVTEDPTAMKDGGTAAGKPLVGSAVLDRLLSELEALANSEANTYKSEDEKKTAHEQRHQHFMKILAQLHLYAKTHVLEVANTFRLILIEAERTFLRGQRKALTKPMMLSLIATANLFPMSDYRHEVSTPFYIFLCSTLMQMKLDSLDCVHCYLGLCALLTQSVRSAGGKFVGEAIAALLNVLALQLPRTTIERVKHQGVRLPIPVMERSDAALLATAGCGNSSGSEDTRGSTEDDAVKGKEKRKPHPWLLLEAEHRAEHLVLCAYHQLTVLADLYCTLPAFPAVFLRPFLALDELIEKKQRSGTGRGVQSAEVQEAHAALKELLESYAQGAEDRRAPLTMRTFRPRPIRLFEPLLEEREESAVKTEIRIMKREMREDKKRLMRGLTAEATVHRRAKEKEQSAIEASREKRMHQVMGALQQQQHMMNTVDAIMAKAKSKSKKGISGAPNTSSGGGGGVDGGGDD